jgi:hypothetical protein
MILGREQPKQTATRKKITKTEKNILLLVADPVVLISE